MKPTRKSAESRARQRTLHLTSRRLDYELGRLAAEIRAAARTTPAVTLAEAAQLIGTSYSTVRRMADRNELRPCGVRGRHPVYDIRVVLEARTRLEQVRSTAKRAAIRTRFERRIAKRRASGGEP
jgi:excisionase family DNA binding protein